MDLVLWINPNFGQGGEGVKKPENFADVLYVWSLKQYEAQSFISSSKTYLMQQLDMSMGMGI